MADEDEPMTSSNESDKGPKVESLIAGRQKRSTAANRYSALLENEDPEDEVNVLFQEEEGAEDAEFLGEDGEGASDVDMGSSDDDDQGPVAGTEEMEGEKEIQKQERAERKKKRKDQVTFKGKLKPRAPRGLRGDLPTATSTPPPRPKKKSERVSWLPTVEDGPVRSSSRKQTVLNKENIHERLKEHEVKRLKQLKQQEAAAKRKEAEKPKALSQADRMAEAHKIEKQNAKSLNRWETEERKRQEERQAKLDALKNRKLEGPVITYWSGPSTWLGEKLISVGTGAKVVEIKEPTKNKPGPKPKVKSISGTSPEAERPRSKSSKEQGQNAVDVLVNGQNDSTEKDTPMLDASTSTQLSGREGEIPTPDAATGTPLPLPPRPELSVQTSASQESPPTQQEAVRSQEQSSYNPSHEPSPAPKSHTSQPPTPEPLSATTTAPPAESGQWSTTMMSHPSTEHPDQQQSQQFQHPPPPNYPTHPPANALTPWPSAPPNPHLPNAFFTPHAPPAPNPAPPLAKEIAARTLIILEKVSGAAAALPELKSHPLLVAKKAPKITAKMQKEATELCAITGVPAHFRDPRTGLAYATKEAYAELQRLLDGSMRWSNLLGCFVGPRSRAAKGVPEGFFGKGVDVEIAKEKEREQG
ncbi:MAG: hypothetical protein MMC23_000637 [Stictis urceolatum]|nr:hypothetical protein [Stictis urceolata]